VLDRPVPDFKAWHESRLDEDDDDMLTVSEACALVNTEFGEDLCTYSNSTCSCTYWDYIACVSIIGGYTWTGGLPR
jgi:hypothetical protein